MRTYSFSTGQTDNILILLNATGADLAFHCMDYYYDLQIDNIQKADDGIHSFFAEHDGKKIGIILN